CVLASAASTSPRLSASSPGPGGSGPAAPTASTSLSSRRRPGPPAGGAGPPGPGPPPPRPPGGVEEPLLAQALVLDDGSRRLALVATDLLWMPRHVAEAARRRIGELTGIRADAVLLNPSHNHSAPVLLEPDSVRAAVHTAGLEGYAAALPDRLA